MRRRLALICAVVLPLFLVISTLIFSPGSAALENEQHEQRALAAPAKERRDLITKERDTIQQRLDRLIDLVAGGDAPGKSVAPKIAELQLSIDVLDRQVATCEAEIAASAMSQANASLLLDHWRTSVRSLSTEPPEIQRQTLQGVLKEAHLGIGKDLRLVCWPLRPGGGGDGGLAGPHPPTPDQGPDAAESKNKPTTVGSDGSRLWRTGGDSNPRTNFSVARFPSACLQPLSHLSKVFLRSGAALSERRAQGQETR